MAIVRGTKLSNRVRAVFRYFTIFLVSLSAIFPFVFQKILHGNLLGLGRLDIELVDIEALPQGLALR